MNKVKRYTSPAIIFTAADGPLVDYTDYAKLAAEHKQFVEWAEPQCKDYVEMRDRIATLEAENARLNMEMAAYRQGCTPKDAAAMVAVMDALSAEKQSQAALSGDAK
jgi:hypothetical protein